MDKPETIEIIYTFQFKDERRNIFPIRISNKTGRYLLEKAPPSNNWIALNFKKCSHCPLKSSQHPDCPVARNIASLVDEFKNECSTAEVKIMVKTDQRIYYKDGTLQDGLHSIFGIMMATSGCPHLDFLKAMAQFHLPMASPEETLVRSVSMYLLQQYFASKRGEEPDWSLQKFKDRYQAVEIVNRGIIERLSSVAGAKGTGDADKNAIMILDGFAKVLSRELSLDLVGLEKHLLASSSH